MAIMDAEMKRELMDEATHWLIITMLHDDRLLASNDSLENIVEKNDDFRALVQHGCDAKVLLNTLAFASTLPACYPPFTANDLRELAKDCRSVIWRMKTLTPSIAMPFIEEDETGKEFLQLQPTGADMHVWPWLEEDIESKALLYEALAEICQEKLLPTRATLKRLGYLWPVVYVNDQTGEPRYARVSRILSLVGILKNEKQLRVGFEGARNKFGGLLQWLTLATHRLNQTAGVI